MGDHHPLFAGKGRGNFDAFTRHHRHELVDDEDKFEVSIDVPGVDEKDIEIDLKEEQGQTLLTVRGRRMACRSDSSDSSSQVTSKFSKTFSLDETVDVDKLTAALKNGVLTVSAPKDPEKREKNIRRIPVVVATATPAADDDGATLLPDEGNENATTGGGGGGDDESMEHAEKEKAEESIVIDVDKEEEEEEGWKTVSKK